MLLLLLLLLVLLLLLPVAAPIVAPAARADVLRDRPTNKGTIYSPYWTHRALFFVLSLLPGWVWASYKLSMGMGIRKKAYKKKEVKKD